MASPSSLNVLISSSGRRVALLRSFRAALSDLGLSGRVLAADASPLSSALHDADEQLIVPRCDDPTFVASMLEICQEHRVDLVIPTIDTELPVWAANRPMFESQGTRVAVSSPEAIAIAGDKVRTHQWLVDHNFPTVRQWSIDQILTQEAAVDFPVFVKPRWGSSSIGVAKVPGVEQLPMVDNIVEMVVQTVAQGDEYTIDVLVDQNGNCRCAVPRRRLEVRAGEVSKAVTEHQLQLEDLAARLCEELPGPFGALNVQVFYHRPSKSINVIEINPRFGGGFPLTWAAGGRYPTWLIEELLDLPSSSSFSSWRSGLVMLRFDDALFVAADAIGCNRLSG